ncbi:hypothetical protein TVAG_449820 [Trichomonas vaginalis G3]|uniref:Clan MH, family M20, peptidase T-like metallopeptidase n=1 Tax=Trichomonas vaginalis (strain ATCC PRA-98 / G3) TaxID=412133 RepID=A2F4C6_TRIV3|nr:cytosolix non-specific dipeptidase family [Trichomonas vaginalis G3]EAY00246.1 hypothetical protein TVAG_449820 [Trichomonas vaginalis G3]KAI5536801.1 cytosolix non-specific dipeptidase family [Trichomonas vaginalis G3]|eukprot:XP_001313175.1 hypothetical protein [Trichomonas vaginalis G3]
MEALLSKFANPPSKLVKQFLELCTISNGFLDINIVTKYIVDSLSKIGIEAKIDENQNITAEIAKNLDFKRTIALHTHLDATRIGELTEIQVEQNDSDYIIKSEKSNFAASTFFAITTMLNVANESSNFKHGPILLIFTVNDELSLKGASLIPKWPALSFNALINLNSFNGDEIVVGGPIGKNFNISVKADFHDPEENQCVVSAVCSGLNGGCVSDVNANAVQWASSVLFQLSHSQIPFRLISLESGDYQYTVSTNYDLKILVPKEKGEEAVNIIHAAHMASVMEYVRSDSSNFNTIITEIQPQKALSVEYTLAITNFLSLLPSGVITNSLPYQGFETASNIGKVTINSEKIEILLQGLAMASGGMDRVTKIIKAAARTSKLNITVEEKDNWPQWGPRRRGFLVSILMSTGKEHFGKDLKLGLMPYAIAPSVLYDNGYDEASYAAIGPKISNFRAVGESISTDQIEKWAEYVISAIKNLA